MSCSPGVVYLQIASRPPKIKWSDSETILISPSATSSITTSEPSFCGIKIKYGLLPRFDRARHAEESRLGQEKQEELVKQGKLIFNLGSEAENLKALGERNRRSADQYEEFMRWAHSNNATAQADQQDK